MHQNNMSVSKTHIRLASHNICKGAPPSWKKRRRKSCHHSLKALLHEHHSVRENACCNSTNTVHKVFFVTQAKMDTIKHRKTEQITNSEQSEKQLIRILQLKKG